MYTPRDFAVDDRARLLGQLRDQPLGLVISTGSAGFEVTPMPFIVHDDGDGLRLIAHMSRANPQWQTLQGGDECLVLFQGDHGYITPNWYETKRTTHETVPTWNYIVMEITGTPTVHTDPEWLRSQIDQLTDHMESRRAQPWSVADAPDAYIATQLRGIVGLEIAVTSISGKWKMSQNRNDADIHGVVSGLFDATDPHADPVLAEHVAREVDAR
jgi:transcriptional regulator